MDYLKRVLDIQVRYVTTEITEHLPNFILNRYDVKKVYLDKTAALFLYPKTELDQVEAIKKQIARIQKQEQLPVVLILEKMTYRQKEYFLNAKIPFIVDGKQIYLPFMAVYLQERGDAEEKEVEKLLPSAQILLLFYIYENKKELLASYAARVLEFTPTSISRALRQLEQISLIRTEKRGVQKVFFSDYTSEELFKRAIPYLNNPVKRKIYIPRFEMGEHLLKSSYLALSEYTMLNPPSLECYATNSISSWSFAATEKVLDVGMQIAVELWRYDPHKLTKSQFVDVLSLALSLKDDPDERVEEALEDLLNEFWRKMNGTRI